MAHGLSIILRAIQRPEPQLIPGSEQPYANRWARRHGHAQGAPAANVPYRKADHAG